MAHTLNPSGPSRTPGLTFICATLVFLLTLSASALVFAQDPDPAPAVTEVRITSRPLSGDTFDKGEEIAARVTFDKPVVVTGNPRLVLWIGDQPRSADLFRVTGGRRLDFRLYVKASDRDADGIAIPANAVRLNRGSIRDAAGQDADLSHEAVPDDPERKVDGRLDAIPTITRVSRLSLPLQGDTFGHGERLIVLVYFSAIVEVTGTAQLTLQVGTQTRQVGLHAKRGSVLWFEYVVQSSDVDPDGYSVPADALTLNGGFIRDADGNEADLTHDALPDDTGHKVDGALGGVPTVRRVRFSREPGSGDTYAAGERIFAFVQFTRSVQVTGAPQLTIQVGAHARRADHLPTLRDAEPLSQGRGFHTPEEDRSLYFEYVVQPSDVDDDGISLPVNALSLNGGSIRAVGDNSDAGLSHDGLPDDPTRKVDGSLGDDQAPTVLQLFVEPPANGTFGRGDAITPRLTLSEGMTVTGAPRIALRIGARTRWATLRERYDQRQLFLPVAEAAIGRPRGHPRSV